MTRPENGKRTLMRSWSALRGLSISCYLTTLEVAICKKSFLRGKKSREQDRLCTKDCFLTVNQSLLPVLALSTQRQTTLEAAYTQDCRGPPTIALCLSPVGANDMMAP